MLPKVPFGLEKLGSKDSRGGPSLSDFQPARVQFLASVKPAPQVQERKAGQTDRQTDSTNLPVSAQALVPEPGPQMLWPATEQVL